MLYRAPFSGGQVTLSPDQEAGPESCNQQGKYPSSSVGLAMPFS